MWFCPKIGMQLSRDRCLYPNHLYVTVSESWQVFVFHGTLNVVVSWHVFVPHTTYYIVVSWQVLVFVAYCMMLSKIQGSPDDSNTLLTATFMYKTPMVGCHCGSLVSHLCTWFLWLTVLVGHWCLIYVQDSFSCLP